MVERVWGWLPLSSAVAVLGWSGGCWWRLRGCVVGVVGGRRGWAGRGGGVLWFCAEDVWRGRPAKTLSRSRGQWVGVGRCTLPRTIIYRSANHSGRRCHPTFNQSRSPYSLTLVEPAHATCTSHARAFVPQAEPAGATHTPAAPVLPFLIVAHLLVSYRSFTVRVLHASRHVGGPTP